MKTATPKKATPDTDDDKYRIVTAPGYVRKTVDALGKVTRITLDAINFRICRSCGHWEFSGAGARCTCPRQCHREQIR